MPLSASPRVVARLVRVGCCAVLIGMAATFALPAPSAEAGVSSVGWLHTSGARIITAAGQPHTIRAVNWFGMETSSCAPGGLGRISLDSGLAQIRSFGFNTIRLPYSSECLHAAETTSIDPGKNPGLVGRSPLELLDSVVARAEAHGLSVILDRHRVDSAGQSELWYTSTYSESAWLADWKMLARPYVNTPTVIGADLHNEPRGAACWGCAVPSRDWAAAATRAGNALLSVNSRLLVVVEGIQHQGDDTDTWWGGGLSDVRDHPITLEVASRLVYSPHDYPVSVAPQEWFSAPDYPANLPGQWDRTWGYLRQEGVAPVLLGEFGTKLESTSDRQWLATLVRYLYDNQHSFAYWSFNPDSGDTGGLVAGDWTTPQTAKLAALRPLGITAPNRYFVSGVHTSRRPVVR